MRLGADLSGRSEKLLAQFEGSARDGKLRLKVKRSASHLMTEQVVKRLEAAANALGLEAEPVFG